MEVDRLAFLYPFGFKVSIIKTSERKTQGGPLGGDDGFLRQHFSIKFEEPFRDFSDWRFPFSRLIPKDEETPYLDFPTSFAMPGGIPSDWRQGAFWPTVLGSPYEFEFIAIDQNGRATHFKAPLICLPLMNNPAGTADPRLAAVQAEYLRDPTRPTRPYFGQAVGFTQESIPLGTSHPLRRIAFDGVLVNRPVSQKIQSPFEPICTSAEVIPDTASALGGADLDKAAWFLPADPTKTKTEVYLLSDASREGQLDLSFVGKSNNAGGIAAPRLFVGGFCRQSGPFGAPSHALNLAPANQPFLSDVFDPTHYLDADASILGVKLSSILQIVTGDAARAAPQILTIFNENPDDLPTIEQSFDWTTEKLQDAPKLGPIAPVFLTQQQSANNVPDPDVPTRFNLNASASYSPLSDDLPDVSTYGRLSNFTIQLAVDIGGEPNGVLLKISEAWFQSRLGEKSQFGIELVSADMIGTVLSFIKQLETALAPALGHVTQLVNISPSGVTITLPALVLPPISLGAMDITDIRITSSVALPFVKRPPEFNFAFSSPEKPFIIAVGIFGGGGSISITLDTEGIQRLSAMFQFGGYRALELGVIKGRIFLFGGLFFSSERLPAGESGSILTLVAFVHAGGEATVLGIVSVGVDFYVSLTYQTGGGSTNLYGETTLSYSVKIGFFSKTASAHYLHVMQGSHSSANLARSTTAALEHLSSGRDVSSPIDYFTSKEWAEYQKAFAA